MRTAAALNELLRKRLLNACFDAFPANDSLSASVPRRSPPHLLEAIEQLGTAFTTFEG